MLARQSPARMLRGGMMIPGVDPGPKWIDDTVHFFFQPAGAKSGIDLMSINIQFWILNSRIRAIRLSHRDKSLRTFSGVQNPSKAWA